MKKRALSLLLVLVMVLGMLPVGVWAASDDAAPDKIALVGSDEELSYESKGYLYFFGFI